MWHATDSVSVEEGQDITSSIPPKAVAFQQKLYSTFANTIHQTGKHIDHLEDRVFQVQSKLEDELSSIHVKLKNLTHQQGHQDRRLEHQEGQIIEMQIRLSESQHHLTSRTFIKEVTTTLIEKSRQALLHQLHGELLCIQASYEKQHRVTCRDLKATQVQLMHQEETQAQLFVHVDCLHEKLNMLEVDSISVQTDMSNLFERIQCQETHNESISGICDSSPTGTSPSPLSDEVQRALEQFTSSPDRDSNLGGVQAVQHAQAIVLPAYPHRPFKLSRDFATFLKQLIIFSLLFLAILSYINLPVALDPSTHTYSKRIRRMYRNAYYR